uniref:Uncharacterized protein n=1 Tax=Arundo donax TaxID=35708 RepID=A0A0A9H4P0_ARUDO
MEKYCPSSVQERSSRKWEKIPRNTYICQQA